MAGAAPVLTRVGLAEAALVRDRQVGGREMRVMV